MGRGKLCMEFIRKEKTRMLTYRKRKAGLMKKAYEFATLCDVDACIIMYGPNDELDVWPENHDKVKAVLDKHRLPENSDMRGRKPQDVSDFFVIRKKKLRDDIAKARKTNKDLRYPLWDNCLEFLSFEDIAYVESVFEATLEVAKRRLVILKGQEILMAFSSSNNNNHLIGHSHQSISIPYPYVTMNQKPLHDLQLSSSYSSHSSNYETPQHQQQSFGYPTVNDSLTRLLMHGEESNGFGGGGCNETSYYDHNIPSSADNLHMMMFNNPRTSLASTDQYYPQGMQPPMSPYEYDLLSTMNIRNSSQFQAPQFTDSYKANANYGMDTTKKYKFNYI